MSQKYIFYANMLGFSEGLHAFSDQQVDLGVEKIEILWFGVHMLWSKIAALCVELRNEVLFIFITHSNSYCVLNHSDKSVQPLMKTWMPFGWVERGVEDVFIGKVWVDM